MQIEFEMSMIGELNFFLGLQIKQTSNGIYIIQRNYVKRTIEEIQHEQCKRNEDTHTPHNISRTR